MPDGAECVYLRGRVGTQAISGWEGTKRRRGREAQRPGEKGRVLVVVEEGRRVVEDGLGVRT